MTRARRPSAYSARPRRMPPDTHYKGAAPPSPDVAVVAGGAVEDIEPSPVAAPVETYRPPPLPAGWPVVAPPAPAVAAPTRGRLRLVLAGIAALVVFLALAAYGPRLVGDGSEGKETAASSGDAAPGEQTPRSPVRLTGNSVYTDVLVRATGDLNVRQWVSSDDPMASIDLAPPEDLGPTGGDYVAEDVRVATANGPVGQPIALSSSRSYPLGGATQVYLSYTLPGVLERSASEPGRALARVTTLDVSYPDRLRRLTFAFRGARALTLACTTITGSRAGAPVACAALDGDLWVVTLPSRGSREEATQVMAQLDLEP